MGDVSYGSFVLIHVSDTPGRLPLIERRMGQYMNDAIKKRDKVTTDYYPGEGSGIKAVYIPVDEKARALLTPDEQKKQTRKVIVYGIYFPLDFIRFAMKGRKIGMDAIIIDGPDAGLPRTNDGEFINWNDKVHHDNILKGCGVFDHPLPIFTDLFWEEIGCPPAARIKNTFKMDYHKDQLDIDGTVKKDKGFLQHVNFKVSDTQKGTKFECRTKFEASQIFRYFNRCPKLCKKNSYPFKSLRYVSTTPHIGFGVNGSYLDVRDEMKNYKYVRFSMLRKDLYHQYRVETLWRSRCVHCKSHYVIHGFHPDLNWLAARCQCPLPSTRTWPGEDFFRVTLAYPQARSNPDFEHHPALKSPPLILMTKGLLPMYDSVEEFEHSCLGAEDHEFEVVEQELAARHAIGTTDRVSDFIQIKHFENDGFFKKLYSLELRVKSEGVWTPEEQHTIGKIEIIPVSEVRPNDDGTPPTVDVLKNHNFCMKGELENIRKKDEDDDFSIVEIRIWVHADMTFDPREAYHMIPLPPKGFLQNTTLAIHEWSQYIKSRNKVTPRTQVSIAKSKIVSCDMEIPQQENRVYNEIEFRVPKNFVTNTMLQYGIVDHIHYCIVLCSDLLNPGKHDEKTTFNGVMTSIRELDEFKNEVIIKAIIECPSSHVPLDRPALVSMWMDRDDSVTVTVNDLELMVSSFTYPGVQHLLKREAKEEGAPKYKPPEPPTTTQDFVKMIKTCPVRNLVDLRDFLLKKTKGNRVQHFVRRAVEKWATMSNISVKDRLNSSQLQAVVSAINNVIGLVEGPPGCGKTWLICWLVLELMRRYEKSGMIIIATPTNLAGNLCAKLLQKLNKEQGSNLVIRRMMAFSKENSKNDGEEDLSVHSAMKIHDSYWANPEALKLIEKKKEDGRNLLNDDEDKLVREHLDYVRMKVLEETDVLICTIDTANNPAVHNILKYMKKPLHGVIMDESNMATSPQHLRLLALHPSHYVMVGDDRQLRKCYSSRTATNANADVSLMRFLMTTEYFKEIAKPVMLKEQYRFAASICKVISIWAYSGLLIPAIFGMPEVPVHLYEDLYKEFPELLKHNMLRVTYDKVQAMEKQSGPSHFNLNEADLIVDLVKKMIVNGKIPSEKITILSLYGAHLIEIQKKLKQDPDPRYKKLTLCTADSFEGQECDIVVVSLVRSNDKTKVGFMRDPSRLTVALSRCKHHMLWVSNEETFATCRLKGIEELYNIMKAQKVPVLHWDFSTSARKEGSVIV